jgi:uncharacterized protein (TIGR01370 family)
MSNFSLTFYVKRIAVVTVALCMLAGCGGGYTSQSASVNSPNEASARPTPTPTPTAWKPGLSDTYQYQLQGAINTGYEVSIYDVDLFITTDGEIRQLKALGKKIICYFSAGSAENWRDDYASFNPADLGANLADWEGERYLDTRSANVRQIMQKRLDLAVQRGCDGVDPDLMANFEETSGFTGLTAQTQIDYNRFIANEAHKRKLVIGLKNDQNQLEDLINYFDFAVNESCHTYKECDIYKLMIAQNKPVFNIQYEAIYKNNTAGARDILCAASQKLGIRTYVMPLLLDDSFKTIACNQ